MSVEPFIIVCIPAYNEAKNIAAIVAIAKLYASEVVVCDDGSIDNTCEIARKAGATVIRHPENKGYGAAIKSLFEYARKRNAQIAVTLDSDGQHNANQIPVVIEPILKEDYDVVIGSRFLDGNSGRVPTYRSFGIKTITKFTQVASYRNITDAQSGFRAYGRRALENIAIYEEGMAISTEILVKAKELNLLIKEVPISINYDVEDGSTHNPLSHGLSVLSAVIRFISIRHPLEFYGLPGIGLLVVAGFFIASAIDLFASSRYVSTNMILVSVGSAVIGSVLLLTGIILYSLTALLKGKIREI